MGVSYLVADRVSNSPTAWEDPRRQAGEAPGGVHVTVRVRRDGLGAFPRTTVAAPAGLPDDDGVGERVTVRLTYGVIPQPRQREGLGPRRRLGHGAGLLCACFAPRTGRGQSGPNPLLNSLG
ncbi:hypothetical protein GCM10010129_45080 [Streptomyces fumigatiscleroticus]|nr:hypothetical protein GCM10010129_45080 [Streptomyces fumigatiscleroticus]